MICVQGKEPAASNCAFLIYAAVSFLDLIMLSSTYLEFVLLLSVLNSFSSDISSLQ